MQHTGTKRKRRAFRTRAIEMDDQGDGGGESEWRTTAGSKEAI